MDISTERELIKKAYPRSQTWASRVNKMGSGQVHAIYIRFVNQKKI